MIPFLQKTAQYIIAEFGDGLADLCIVLPNRRGGLFLRKYLAAEIGKISWAPTVYSIEDFMGEMSGLQEVEPLHLLFELYEVHKEIEGVNAQDFEEFLRWAPQLISDFNEVDRYMAEAGELFSTLTEARAIALWNLDGQPLTEFEKKYLRFYQSLAGYYQMLNTRLLAKNQAYQGLGFRQAATKIENNIQKLPWQHIVFAGFNALTKAEEKIFETLKNAGKATILWDADHYYLDNPQQEAGDFLRGWLKKWPLKDFKWIFNDFAASEKLVEIIGSPDPLGQVKCCAGILQTLARNDQANEGTAVVLLDEGLLFPLLNSMPQEIDSLNITAGLPLVQTPLASLFDNLFQLHLHATQFTLLAKTGSAKYYYRDVLKLLQHPYVRRIARNTSNGNNFVFEETIARIRKGHKVFIGLEDITSQKVGLFGVNIDFLEVLLAPWKTTADALRCFSNMIGQMQPGGDDAMETEYLFAFSKVIHQIDNLQSTFQSGMKIEVLYTLFQQIVKSTSLPFYGEPLKGVQIMGMLETRTLDFRNLIILSCNEDLLPSGKLNASYIPFDIKRNFGLPTYRHKDSVYAYHFYRLIQRAEKVWILYNTEPDQLGGGDRSRFLRQIERELPAYNPKITIREMILATPIVKGRALPVIEIPKTTEVLTELETKAAKGFSASSLNMYRNCPLKFYYSEIAGIKEPEDLEDTIDPAVLGSAVHEALYRLFEPYSGKPMSTENLSAMEKASDEAVDHAFEKKFKGTGITTGENLLHVSVARLMVKRFLQYEAQQLDDLKITGKGYIVTSLERYVEHFINLTIEGRELKVRLKGFIDRVDQMNGCWRIIDYKTGTVESRQVKIKAWDDLWLKPELNIGFQLLMYNYLLSKQFDTEINSEAGIFSLKRISAGFIPVSVPDETSGKQTFLLNETTSGRFGGLLLTILEDIFDAAKPFSQTDDINTCSKCPYINLCGR